MNRHILVILDGYGVAEDPTVSAIDRASKPFLDELFSRYPNSTLSASGLDVGLPEGQMGNSEVGHLNLGAGRVVYQDITRIDLAIEDESFFDNSVLKAAVAHARNGGGRLHLLGLVSDGGVHSTNAHIEALLTLAHREGLTRNQVCLHAFTDGRDTAPDGGADYLRQLQTAMDSTGTGCLASVIGRYYAMDRDNRWERIKLAFDLLTAGVGTLTDDAVAAVEASYASGKTDEFIDAIAVGPDVEQTRIQPGDAAIFFNFRADRARQLTRALTEKSFDGFERPADLDLHYVTFTPYHASFDHPIAFGKENLQATLGEIIEKAGGRQLRAAETEKYPHVTFFFSGGREAPFDGEERVLVPSPKVATYDLQPEMSAPELAAKVAAALAEERFDLVILNFANADMVGHTGVFEAAVKAVEAVDAATRLVVEAALEHGYSVQVIADHGNADRMSNPDGSPHTAHTTVPVPHLIIREGFEGPLAPGRLADVAPTILDLMGVDQPSEMTGRSLLSNSEADGQA